LPFQAKPSASTVTDRVVDLLFENIDVGIRTGPINDLSLVVRKITDVERGLFASPVYLARRGTPLRPEQLQDHDCIVLSFIPSAHRWLFRENGQAAVKSIDIVSRVLVDSAEAALQLAIAGGGITRVGDMLVGQAIRDGLLVPVLTESHVIERVPLSAVYPHGRQRMPKVRVFLEFLVERFRYAPWRVGLAV
jgi:DNA-binding transcriptional LysR family regulator